MAIWGIIRRKGDSWVIRIENANLGEFEGLGNGGTTSEQEKVLVEIERKKREEIMGV